MTFKPDELEKGKEKPAGQPASLLPEEPILSAKERQAQVEKLEGAKQDSAKEDAKEMEEARKEAGLPLEKKETAEEEGFKPSQELEKAEDLGKTAEWFKKEVSNYVDANEVFMMGYSFEDLVQNLGEYLEAKMGIKDSGVVVDSESKTKYVDEESPEGITTGSVTFMGKKILTFSSDEAGSGVSVDSCDDENLKEALKSLLKIG